ncbi:MAG: hypothetical protein DRP09_18585 [Candidatus Thorarchaeota archaeon]|nr:MAG: hypothetical protein DRP09_18585 [Candidatus Thorarchaeota archaeon]
MWISVVMPVHNEEEYLPYSLPSLIKSPIDELVVVLDRCTDHSEKIIRKTRFPFKVVLIEKNQQNWRCPTAEVFELGFSFATGDLFYTMAADMIVDPKQFNPKLFEDADLISFFYYNYDLHHYKIKQWYLNFLKKYVNISWLWKGKALAWQSGHMGFKREVWETLHIRDVPSEYDDFQKRALQHGFRYKFVKNVNNLHLRVGLRKDRQMLQGMSRAQRNVHPLLVLGHSIVQMKPYVWTSYYYERKYKIFEKRKWGKNGF